METYIKHHGILGQKWGQRNGPPYPLSAGAHSSSEKKAGWRKSLSGNGEESSKKYSVRRYLNDDGSRTESGQKNRSALMRRTTTVTNSEGKIISGREKRAILKDMKTNDPEAYRDFAKRERKINWEANRQFNARSGLGPMAVESIMAKKRGMTLKEYYEDQDQKYLDSVDKLNQILADHGNKMASVYGSAQDMSDTELDTQIKRLSKESQYAKYETAQSKGMSNDRKASDMTTQELLNYNNRRQAEDTYKQYQSKDAEKKTQGLRDAQDMVNKAQTALNSTEKSVRTHFENERKKAKNSIDLSNVSDDDLRRVVNRMNMERQYRDLTSVEVSRGEKVFNTVMSILGPTLAAAATGLGVAVSVKTLANKK